MFTTIVSTARRVIGANAESPKSNAAEHDATWRTFSASHAKNITGLAKLPSQVDIQLVITEIHKRNHTPIPLPNIPAIPAMLLVPPEPKP